MATDGQSQLLRLYPEGDPKGRTPIDLDCAAIVLGRFTGTTKWDVSTDRRVSKVHCALSMHTGKMNSFSEKVGAVCFSDFFRLDSALNAIPTNLCSSDASGAVSIKLESLGTNPTLFCERKGEAWRPISSSPLRIGDRFALHPDGTCAYRLGFVTRAPTAVMTTSTETTAPTGTFNVADTAVAEANAAEAGVAKASRCDGVGRCRSHSDPTNCRSREHEAEGVRCVGGIDVPVISHSVHDDGDDGSDSEQEHDFDFIDDQSDSELQNDQDEHQINMEQIQSQFPALAHRISALQSGELSSRALSMRLGSFDPLSSAFLQHSVHIPSKAAAGLSAILSSGAIPGDIKAPTAVAVGAPIGDGVTVVASNSIPSTSDNDNLHGFDAFKAFIGNDVTHKFQETEDHHGVTDGKGVEATCIELRVEMQRSVLGYGFSPFDITLCQAQRAKHKVSAEGKSPLPASLLGAGNDDMAGAGGRDDGVRANMAIGLLSRFSFGQYGLPIAEVSQGLPANLAGLKANDVVTHVNDRCLKGLDVDQCIALIRKEGEPITGSDAVPTLVFRVLRQIVGAKRPTRSTLKGRKTTINHTGLRRGGTGRRTTMGGRGHGGGSRNGTMRVETTIADSGPLEPEPPKVLPQAKPVVDRTSIIDITLRRSNNGTLGFKPAVASLAEVKSKLLEAGFWGEFYYRFAFARGGLVVDFVEPGGASATAGLRVGDVITCVGGMDVSTLGADKIVGAIKAAGSKVAIQVHRYDKQAPITCGDRLGMPPRAAHTVTVSKISCSPLQCGNCSLLVCCGPEGGRKERLYTGPQRPAVSASWEGVEFEWEELDAYAAFMIIKCSAFQDSEAGRCDLWLDDVDKAIKKSVAANGPAEFTTTMPLKKRGVTIGELSLTMTCSDCCQTWYRFKIPFSMANIWCAGFILNLMSVKKPQPDRIRDHRGATVMWMARSKMVDTDHPPPTTVIWGNDVDHMIHLGQVVVHSVNLDALTLRPLEAGDEVLRQRIVRVGVLDDCGVQWATVTVKGLSRPSVQIGDLYPEFVQNIAINTTAPAGNSWCVNLQGNDGNATVRLSHTQPDGVVCEVAKFLVVSEDIRINPSRQADLPRAVTLRVAVNEAVRQAVVGPVIESVVAGAPVAAAKIGARITYEVLKRVVF